MTKVETSKPPAPIKTHERDRRAQDVDFSLADENVVDVSDSDDDSEYNMINYTDVPMHHFGVPSDDPASYRTNTALRDEFHFTNTIPASDIGYIPAGLDDLLREEFAQADVLDRLSDSYVQTPDFSQGLAETGILGYDDLIENMSHWPQQSDARPQTTHRYVPQPCQFSPPLTFNQLSLTVQPVGQGVNPSAGTGLRQLKPRIGPARPAHRAPPDALGADGKENVKGRKRPLSPNARATASRLRIIGACARCHEKHEQCSEERPCKPCMSTAKRSLDFFCMQELPKDRHVHLFTDHLYGHLTIKEGGLHIPGATLNFTNKPFKLRLVQYFDVPELYIPVIRFEPASEYDIRKLIFPITRDGSKYQVTADEILSPPLVPFIKKDDLPVYVEKFKILVYQWLDYADKTDQLEWHTEYFREEYGKAWPRGILQTVCQFYHQVMRGGCQPLRTALQSTILVYMIGHSFYVPEEDIKDVLDRTGLQDFYTGEFMFVAPQYVNRFIKALLYQFLKATVRLALKCYQDLCSPHKHTKLDRDRILAVSIVLLIVAGSIQSKAIEKAEASRLRNGPVNNHQYYERIEEIEKWIIDLVCDIWIYKFGRNGKIKPDDDPSERLLVWEAKRFNLMEKFRSSYENHATELDALSTQLPSESELEKDWKTFGTTNIDRVLKRFYHCVYHTANKSSDSQVRAKRELVPDRDERKPRR